MVRFYMRRKSRLASWGLRFSVAGVLLFVVAALMNRFELIEPALAGAALALALALTVLGLICGLTGLYVTRRHSGYWGMGRAWLGVIVAAVFLVISFAAFYGRLEATVIHDITTDGADVPQFDFLAQNRRAYYNSLAYGGAETWRRQQEVYPDIVPLLVADANVRPVYQTALEAAHEIGWFVAVSQAPGGDRFNSGMFEAVDTTLVWGFRDDIVVRVVRQGDLVRIDMRSVSRVGEGDMGVNAARIMAYFDLLRERLG